MREAPDARESGLFDSEAEIYRIKLESFEGPLDLLLHLIRKNEVDIYDIPISTITKQYLDYVKLMKDLNLEVAGEFLVMASTLIQIKSKMLLPPQEDEESEEEIEDPRAELVRRLLEYQKYKDAAQVLAGRELLGREVFARTFPSPELAVAEVEETPPDLDLYHLIEAFQKVLARIPAESFHQVGEDTISINDRIAQILEILLDRDLVEFDELFEGEITRDYVVVTFLAVLELCKMRTLKVLQKDRYGTIWIMPSVGRDEDEGSGAADDGTES